MDKSAILERRIERERRARRDAEDLIEQKSLELYFANQRLREANATLELRVEARTRELAVARDAALAGNRAKSEFLASMSHELRTPLNSIIGFSEILKSEMLGPLGTAQYRCYAADILDSGTHLLSLINDLLDLAKIEAGKLELHDEDCDVSELVAASVHLLRERALRANVTLQTECDPALPLLRADQRKVRQILFNLLTNSIKFTPTGGSVSVQAGTTSGGDMTVTVRDTGIGIPPGQIKRVLEPFVQVENVLTRTHAGSGLGLPLCRELAELHGGELTLTSELGRGTTVTVTFPKERILVAAPFAAAASAAQIRA